MRISQQNTTNPLHIKRIGRHQIDLMVNRDNAGLPISFTVDSLALEDLRLPGDSRIKLFAYTKTKEQSVDLGTIDEPQTGKTYPLEVDTGSPVVFRIIVRDSGSPKILASCEGLKAITSTDPGGRQHLLPVEPSDKLGEKLWELRVLGDEEPVIFVNNDPDINMLSRLKGDRVFQALILPQAFELVLLHLVANPGDDDGWQAKWKTYLSARDIEIPDDPEPEARAEWAREASHLFAKEHSLLSHARTQIVEGSHDA